MDLFSLAVSSAANQELSGMLTKESQLVHSTLSDETRNILMTTNAAIMAASPQATQSQVDRAKAMIGGILDHKQLESLLDIYSLQTSNLHTARTTLSHPTIANLHRLGQTDAYGEEYNALRNNLLYNRILSGFSGLDGDIDNHIVTNYADNYRGELLKDYEGFSYIEKQTIHRNFNAALFAIFDDGEDIGSVHGGTF
ncbi:hypothetical protein TSMG0137 [Halocynthia phage JM-2012]|uniref:hypothetical protein n=1 Tax=Halocynthia phage JM-2012 TaxID=1173297 RepID=UPI00025C6965|nr:hypothetical protein TSMG0137 [Halocynthia phage JM-2012]AFI55420.1 hypothetical protein TSMG0137 [Halocynthia phage JM-2012]